MRDKYSNLWEAVCNRDHNAIAEMMRPIIDNPSRVAAPNELSSDENIQDPLDSEPYLGDEPLTYDNSESAE